MEIVYCDSDNNNRCVDCWIFKRYYRGSKETETRIPAHQKTGQKASA